MKELKKGERILLSPAKCGEVTIGKIRWSGNILSVDGDGVTVELDTDIKEIRPGDGVILIIERPDYYNEFHATVMEKKKRVWRLKWHWPERREFFRIDDLIGISARKICPEMKRASRIIHTSSGEVTVGGEVRLSEFDIPDPSISPGLWKILNEINRKLNILLERMNQQKEDAPSLEYQKVNISAGGIRFISSEKVERGDIMEVRLLLPTCPPLDILTYGEVVRIKETDHGYEVALSFKEIEEEVKEAILRYTIQKQREQLRKQR